MTLYTENHLSFLRVDRTRDCLKSLETIEDFPEVTLLALHVAVQYMAILSQIDTHSVT